MNPWIVTIVMAVVFMLLAGGIYLLLQSLILREKIKANVDKVYSQLSERNEKRVRDLELQRRLYGNIDSKKNVFEKYMDKLDHMLVYSGFSVAVGWLNTSTYLVLNMCGGALIFLVTFLLTNNLVLAILFMVVPMIALLLWMSSICDQKYKSVEGQLSFCVNMVANVSGNTNDLVTVFDQVAPYLGEPLRSAIQRAVSVAGMTGSAADCVNMLAREIEHPLFIRFVRNLEVCSKADADYKNVARDYAPQVERFVRAAERKRAIFANGRSQILLLTVLGMGLIYASSAALGAGFAETIEGMLNSLLGMVVLVFEGILFSSAILYAIFGMRR